METMTGAEGIVNIDFKEEGKNRNNDHPAP